jgi:hypothetical protein
VGSAANVGISSHNSHQLAIDGTPYQLDELDSIEEAQYFLGTWAKLHSQVPREHLSVIDLEEVLGGE